MGIELNSNPKFANISRTKLNSLKSIVKEKHSVLVYFVIFNSRVYWFLWTFFKFESFICDSCKYSELIKSLKDLFVKCFGGNIIMVLIYSYDLTMKQKIFKRTRKSY